jgi:hypothetical protein
LIKCRFSEIIQSILYKVKGVVVPFIVLHLKSSLCRSYTTFDSKLVIDNYLKYMSYLGTGTITFFKGGPADPSLQEKEHPTTSKIHATLDSCPL